MRAKCCICSDLFENKSSNIAALPCGHTFHEDCLMRWMEMSSTCPSCRCYVWRSRIIKRLFFDIQEDNCEDEDVDKLLNQISNLKAQVSEKDKQRQEIAELKDYYFTRFAVAVVKSNEEKNERIIMQRDLRLLQEENSVLVEEMKEFQETQKQLQELQNVETLLKGCDSDIQDIVGQYSEASESSVKQLASLLTVLKREYNQVLADNKSLRRMVVRTVEHYTSEVHKSKMEIKELKEALIQVERENNENQRKLVQLQDALRYSKTEDSQSFHRVLNQNSPNVAFTPPKFLDTAFNLGDDEENCRQNVCLTPDLLEESPKLHRNYLERKLKFANVQTAAERFKSGKQNSLDILADDPPKIPQDMLCIKQKKLTGQSNSQAHVPSVITLGYDEFGGSETFVHRQGQSSVSLKLDSKKDVGRQTSQMNSKLPSTLLAKQPQINNFAQSHCHLLMPSSSLLSSVEEIKDSWKLKSKTQVQTDKPGKKDEMYDARKLLSSLTMKTTAPSSSSPLKNSPKLSPDDPIDFT